jgi:hypothetical protein
VVAATGSVGATIAPSAKAAAHGRPPTTSWATTATATIVASTSPMASIEIDRRSAFRLCRSAKNAPL